jgi:hypothetical protein
MFLDLIPYNKKALQHKFRNYTAWLDYANVIYKPKCTKEDLISLLQMELVFGRREMIIKRIYSRFSRLRYLHEKEEMHKPYSGPDIAELCLSSFDKMEAQLPDDLKCENTVWYLLQSERAHKRRGYMMNLLYGRYSSLRRQREISELIAWAKAKRKEL